MALFLDELIARQDATTLACGARRTGAPSARPRILAATWARPVGARRILRRADEVGAGAFLRVLVEHAGTPVALTEPMRPQADRLRGWAPVALSAATATLPLELGAALCDAAEVERGFIGTLVGRLDRPSLAALATELDLDPTGTQTSLQRRIASRILALEDTAIDRDAAAELARIGHLRNDEIEGVRPVPGHRGAAFDVATTAGTFRIAPREHAVRIGLNFEPPEFQPRAASARSHGRQRVPTVLPVGALITFSTTRAADDALNEAEFRDMVVHRVDERRVVTRAGLSVSHVRARLADLGFDLTNLAEGTRRARS